MIEQKNLENEIKAKYITSFKKETFTNELATISSTNTNNVKKLADTLAGYVTTKNKSIAPKDRTWDSRIKNLEKIITNEEFNSNDKEKIKQIKNALSKNKYLVKKKTKKYNNLLKLLDSAKYTQNQIITENTIKNKISEDYIINKIKEKQPRYITTNQLITKTEKNYLRLKKRKKNRYLNFENVKKIASTILISSFIYLISTNIHMKNKYNKQEVKTQKEYVNEIEPKDKQEVKTINLASEPKTNKK